MRRLRLPILLTALGLLGALAVIPLLLSMIALMPAGRTPPPLPLLVLGSVIQATVLAGAAAFGGVALARRIALPLGALEFLAEGRAPPAGTGRRLLIAGGVGAAVGLALLLLDALIPSSAGAPAALADLPLWRRLLAGLLYGGVNEELLLRLFLVSLLAWLLARAWRPGPVRAGPMVMTAAILGAAVLFGLGHLPAAAMLGELTPAAAVKILALNGLAGGVFGTLYWRQGLDSAMAAHAAAHLPLQLLAGVVQPVA